MLEWVVVGLAFVGQTIGAVVWGVRQEGRINVQEQRIADLKELINTRFDASDNRLDRIELCLNGRLKNV